uniref:Grass carp reovirus (GCRV)-induced gene 2l n=1 Tax=Sinocyclocheilus rhinocerous TaxID=307959 RepID=A0A673KPT5_9TELE
MWAEDDLGPIAPPCLEKPEDGNIYIMYHGTSRENAEKVKVSGFKQSPENACLDVISSGLDLPENQRLVLRAKVNVGRKTWHDQGYDTAWCPPKCGMVPSGLEEDCVWDPKRITVIDLIYPVKEEQSACRIL